MSTENKPSDHFKIKVGLGPDGGLWNPKFSNEQFPIQERWLVNIEAFEQLKGENEKLKSLFSVQLDMLEQNKQMSDEITALKSKLEIAKKGLKFYSDLYVFDEAIVSGKRARQALKEIEG